MSPLEPSPGNFETVCPLVLPPSPPVAEQCVPNEEVPPSEPSALYAPPEPPAPIVTETELIDVTSTYFMEAPPPVPAAESESSAPPPPPPPPTTVTLTFLQSEGLVHVPVDVITCIVGVSNDS